VRVLLILSVHVNLNEKEQQLRDAFAIIDDPHERLNAVVERFSRTPPLPEYERNEANRVHGCVSLVWLVGEVRDGRCHFRCDAEGPLVKGLVGLLCGFFNGATAPEIVASNADPLRILDLAKNLSPTRRNGLASTRATLVAFAQQSLIQGG
jgi:cysteine desulfuration protein SufE